MAIVRVALPVPLPQVFDYTAEDAGAEDVGRCVKVPFGRGERTGLIVGLGDEAAVEAARLKAVLHIQRGVPPLPADWLELVGFVARYYHAPLGEVVALALPPGLRRADGVSDEDEDPLLGITAEGREALAPGRRASRPPSRRRSGRSSSRPWKRPAATAARRPAGCRSPARPCSTSSKATASAEAVPPSRQPRPGSRRP